MGNVLVVMKVFPKEEAVLADVLARVKAVSGCVKAEIIDFVFGSKVIQASFLTQDGSGRDFEEEVSHVEGVSNVQVEEVGLVS